MSERVPVKTLELYLIRHGETSGNAGTFRKPDEHEQDPYLNERGRRQADLVGKRMAALALDAVFASGLERAVDTAACIARQQPENGCRTVSILPILCENGVRADYPGHSLAYYRQKYPVTVADGVDGDSLIFASEGFDDAALYAKGEQAIRYFCERFTHGEKVAAVAHGGFNTFLLLAAMRVRPEGMVFDVDFYNTGVTKIIFYDEHGGNYGEQTKVAFLNDTSHLYEEFPSFGFYDDPARHKGR